MLPGVVGYLDAWLKAVIHTDCWTTAEGVISHSVQDKFHDWRKAASEIVLVGVLRGSSAEDRWTTRLAVERAKVIEELFLETQPEWKLYELLELNSITFTLFSTPPKLIDENNPVGRVWFVLSDTIRVRYQGVAKFVVKDIVTGWEDICADEREVINRFSKYKSSHS